MNDTDNVHNICCDIRDIRALAAANRQRAEEILRELRLREVWQQAGVRAEVVGSLRSGLLCRHLDIDLHLYTPAEPCVEESFAVVARIAANPRIRRVEYGNLLDAEDRCLEWHVQYEDRDGRRWQIDMILMAEDSPWAGYFERVADRIAAALTPETRDAILRLKYETPDDEHLPGIVCYRAVLEGGVRTRSELEAWLCDHPVGGIVTWMP